MKTLIFITLFLLVSCGYNATGPEENGIVDTTNVDTTFSNQNLFRLFVAPLDGSSGKLNGKLILTDSATDIVTMKDCNAFYGKVKTYYVPKRNRVQIEVDGVANNIPIVGVWKGHYKLAPLYAVRVNSTHISFVEE
jgi:hypothetical protein